MRRPVLVAVLPPVGLPVRLRCFYLDDQAVDQLASRATALRMDALLHTEAAS